MKNMRILFIAPSFHNYHTEIIKTMENDGAYVDFYPEDITTVFFRTGRKLSNVYAQYAKKKYLNQILNSINSNVYDLVFVIRGSILTIASLEILKEKLPNAWFVMYQWDSNRQSRYIKKINFFDSVKTFDLYDAKKYSIEYQPLFYTKSYKEISTVKKRIEYDLVFFGAYHSDRLEVIKKVHKFCTANSLVFKYHLYITKLSLLKNLLVRRIKFSDLKFFKTYKISNIKILNSYLKARSVLDIELNIQSGITMRTFEALGSGTKVITTNPFITKDTIYSSDNIFIINRKNPVIDLDFLKTEFNNNSIYEKYYIDNWLNNIIKDYAK
ncbi:hypothetical protein N9H67_02070 [Methylophilaceae bacterium]|jgi:hypothetical protein|nr:hypothetical protein [Methylophilaceae bacterium]